MNRYFRALALGCAVWAAGQVGSTGEDVRAGDGRFSFSRFAAPRKKPAHRPTARAVSEPASVPSARPVVRPVAATSAATAASDRAARYSALTPPAPTSAFPTAAHPGVRVFPAPLSQSESETTLVAPAQRTMAGTGAQVAHRTLEDAPVEPGTWDGCGSDSLSADSCAAEGCTDDSCVPSGDDDCVTVSDDDACWMGPASCAGAGCGGCSSCGDCYAPGFWRHRTGAFGEFLYLQPTGGDVSFVQVRDGAVPLGSVPMGPVTVTDPDYSPGFRAGFSIANTPCSSFRGAYTHFESRSVEATAINAPFALHSLLTYPGTINAYAPSLQAQARHDVDFQFIDIDYRRVVCHNRCSVVNYSIGARYGQLDQDFLASQPITPGTTSVLSQVNFNGGGIRAGLDGEYHACRSGLYIYGNALVSALTGRIHADYTQANTFGLTQATTSWKDDRIVPVLEYEVGLGWQTPNGRLKLRAGYYVAAWYNMVTTGGWINAVRSDNFVNVDDVLTFDGLVSRVEVNF